MIRWLSQRLALLFLLGTAAVFTSSPLACAAEAAEAAEDPAPDAQPAAEAEHPPASEVFIPTEEISEDFAVSFPVDI